MGKLGCFLVLMLIVAVPIAASQVLPWWGTLILLGGGIIILMAAGPRLIGWGVKRYLLGLFMTKSRVLRGARVTIHQTGWTVKPETILAPDDQNLTHVSENGEDGLVEDSQEDQNLRYLLVDFTLTPGRPTGQMRFYEVTELMLVPHDATVSSTDDPTAEEVIASVAQARMIDEQGSETAEFDKISGEHRFRIIFACPETLMGRVKFRYYFEQFGELMLPPSLPV